MWILWYVLEKISLDEVKDARFFLIFILVIVPFVMLIYFGLATLNYDVMTRSGWPQTLPLRRLSPPVLGVAAFSATKSTSIISADAVVRGIAFLCATSQATSRYSLRSFASHLC